MSPLTGNLRLSLDPVDVQLDVPLDPQTKPYQKQTSSPLNFLTVYCLLHLTFMDLSRPIKSCFRSQSQFHHSRHRNLYKGTYLLLVVTFYHVCRRRLPACWERILFNLDGFSHLTITPCHLQHQKTSYLWVPHSYHDCTQIRRSCLKYANCSS